MICRHCGSQIADSAQFCIHCGQKTEPPAPAQTPEVPALPGTPPAAGPLPDPAAQNAPALPLASAAVKDAVVPPPTAYVGYDANKKEAAIPGAEKPKRSKLPLILGAAATALIGIFAFIGGSGGGVPADAQPAASEPETDLSQAAIEELAGYVAEAQALVIGAYDQMEALNADTEAYVGDRMRQSVDILQNMLGEVSGIEQQAKAVTGAGSTLETAAGEYFSMVRDAQTACIETLTFFADYLEFGDEYLWDRPLPKDYAQEDYYNALYTWYQRAKEGYDAFTSCPACLEPEWERYGEILDLNHNISYKLYEAQQYDDYLRYRSALNMSDRYVTAEDIQYNAMYESLTSEKAHFLRQKNLADALAQEIAAYAQLDEAGREGYVFENVKTGRIVLEYDAVDTIYPSLYNSYDAFLVIRTGCMSGTRKVLIEAEIPGFTQVYRETMTLDPAYTVIRIKPPALAGDLDLTSAKSAQIQVTVSEADGTLIEAKTFPVTIKSKYDFEWYSDEYGLATRDNILCFMTPESAAITDLKRLAIDEISGMTDGDMQSFVGYQGNPWNNHFVGTYVQAAGIMRALYESGVRYNMDPFSISGSNQHILFPENVLAQRSGLCIETSLVVASALQSANMHVFLIFPPGHAQVAVEIWNGTGSSTAGTGQYFLIETTQLDSSNTRDIFENGIELLLDNKGPGSGPVRYYNRDMWKEYLTEDVYVIDCADSSVLGMTPFAN